MLTKYTIFYCIILCIKPGSNEDESRWELAGESLHECFLNSHCSVKRVYFRAKPGIGSNFKIFGKQLWRGKTVTCRWYVIYFLLFVLLIIMGNDLDIACFWFSQSVRKTLRNIGHFIEPVTAKCKPLAVYNSHWLSCNSHDQSNELNFSSKFEPAQSWWECMRGHMRVDESWRSNESESCDSHPLSSSFDQALKQQMRVLSEQTPGN